MALKSRSESRSYNFLFLIFVFCVSCKISFAMEEEMHDFFYQADLVTNMDKSIFGAIGELFTGSEIEEDILSLRTFAEQNKRVSNMRSLTDRIESDINEIYKKTHKLGFYDTVIRYKTHVLDKNKTKVTVFVDFGKIFKLKLNVKYLGKDLKFNKEYSDRLCKEVENLTSSIIDMKQLIKEAVRDLQKNGYYQPEIIEKKVRLNYKTKEAVLNLVIDPNEKVRFAKTKIKAFPGINKDFIENRILWNEEELFNIEKLEQTSNDLYSTQIFSKVEIIPEEEHKGNNKIPVSVLLKEDKKHVIDVSLLYSGMRSMNFEKKSNANKQLKSVIGRLSWTNINAFGGGEKLRFIVEGSPMRTQARRSDYAFEAFFSQPDCFVKDNTIEYTVSRRQELTNVFFKKSDKVSILFRYPMWIFSFVKSGVILEKNYVDSCEDFGQNYTFNKYYEDIVIPFECAIDNTDNMLNPTSGYRITASYFFMKLRKARTNNLHYISGSFSYNMPLDHLKRSVFAFNVGTKRIIGKKIDDIPFDKRIYAGGMGSVRGYGNQLATDAVIGYDTVMGGKASIEFNAEIRRKLSKDFGAVIFCDGSKVFQNKSRQLRIANKRWFYSVGVGIRYFTSIGPIRADLAFPIARRKGIDSKMQFILSLGQAF